MMNRILMLFLVLIIYLQTAHAQTNELKLNTNDNTLLWQISGNGLAKPSFLFGTFHLACKDDIQLSESLKQAITNSNEVYLELDMDDPATLLGGLSLLNMQGGKKLKDLYDTADYSKIVNFFKDSLQMYIGMFQGMKPGFLTAMLYPKMLGCKNTLSIEDAVMRVAKTNGKEIKGLETMALQAAIFDSIPYEEQAKELLKLIDSLEISKIQFSLLYTAYKQQRMDELEKMIMSPEFGMEMNQEILLDDRNKNWVGQLKEIMNKKAVFIAVGAGHLVGEKGLIALLRAAGYMVRGLENK